MTNRFPGKCHACGKHVEAGEGEVEQRPSGRGRHFKWVLWCMSCFNASDCSGPEDRACGNRAYEDACARACGFDSY